MKLYIFLALTLTLQFTVSAQDDFRYVADVDHNGKFHVNIEMDLPADISLKGAMKKLTLQKSLMKELDQDFVSYKTDKDISQDLNVKGKYQYSSETKSKKSGVVATLLNKCDVLVAEGLIQTDCILSKAGAPFISKLISNGRTTTTCTGKENQRKYCKIEFSGKTRDINMLIVKRTAPRLALAGAIKTITLFYKHHYRVTNEKLFGYTNKNFYVNNIEGLYPELLSYLDEDEKLEDSSNLKFNSTESGYKIKLSKP